AYDIIFFWVVRMVFSALELMGEVPFEHVFIHGLLRDSQGRKMSKSLGNGVDPLEIINEYGADALRFMLTTGNSPGNDIRFYMERVESSRNFANKLWNASRFVLMNVNEEELAGEFKIELTLSDEWILSRLNTVIDQVTVNLEKFELGIAAQKLYDFIWSEYCDWYIELVKPRLYGQDFNSKRTAQTVLLEVLESLLKLLHPFMPYITEEIWGHLPNSKGCIIVSQWPKTLEEKIKPLEEKKMELIMDAIKNIRNIRAEMNVVPSRKAKVIVVANKDVFNIIEENKDYLITLANASEVTVQEDKKDVPVEVVSAGIDGAEIFIPLDELVDFEKELERLEKEKSKLQKELDRVNKKLSNQGFISKAPEKLIEEEKQKKDKYQEMYDKVLERLEYTKNKLR
ncbi:MAG: class I tRNA ligase family protein, partial [Clostridia bacterium]|nr:class I tRNA ligase family protein [Clostridia bacterium]